MLAPTPVLRPSPLDISGLFAGSTEALKRRFWLLVLLALLPSILTMVLVAGGVLLLAGTFAVTVGGLGRTVPAIAIVGVLVILVGVVVGGLAQLKSYGMLSLAAYEIAQGGQPTFRGLLTRSRGFLPRMASLIGLGIAIVVVVYALLFGIVFAAVGAAASTSRYDSTAPLIAIGVVFLFLLVSLPLALFLNTKLLYTLPAVAIEGRGGIDGLKRSWQLTRGSFWRTLGYYLVGYLAVLVATYMVSFISQALLGSSASRISSIPSDASPAEVLGRLSVLVPTFLISTVLQLVVSAVTVPFLHAYSTYMFIDQVRRAELPPASTYGYPPAPGYYTPPSQYYGQPQQGHPGQHYGHPAAPPQPGQQYPGQQYPGSQPYPGPQQYPGAQQYPGPQYPSAGGQQYPPEAWGRPQNPDGTGGQQPS